MDDRRAQICSFVEHCYSAVPASVRLRITPIRRGLESHVSYVRAEYRDRRQCSRRVEFVFKQVQGHLAREVAAYRLVLAGDGSRFAPRLHFANKTEDGVQLYLEWIRPWRAWPWRQTNFVIQVMERLALAHSSLSERWFRAPHDLARWDYECELLASAVATVEVFERAHIPKELRALRRALPAVRRLTAALGVFRRQIEHSDLGVAVLHGDAHSGNVVVRVRAGHYEPILLDWARTRLGSPLEDVSSWLQCLRYWEPDARRFHDTLLRHYLEARGFSTGLSRSLRDAYWLAAASNGLAGAIRYHLLVMLDEGRSMRVRSSAQASLRDWLRIIRRADAAWRA